MPVETRKGSMLCAFVLQKQWALLGPELLQISEIKMGKKQDQKLYNQPPPQQKNYTWVMYEQISIDRIRCVMSTTFKVWAAVAVYTA